MYAAYTLYYILIVYGLGSGNNYLEIFQNVIFYSARIHCFRSESKHFYIVTNKKTFSTIVNNKKVSRSQNLISEGWWHCNIAAYSALHHRNKLHFKIYLNRKQ